jgi:hypothetical protein
MALAVDFCRLAWTMKFVTGNERFEPVDRGVQHIDKLCFALIWSPICMKGKDRASRITPPTTTLHISGSGNRQPIMESATGMPPIYSALAALLSSSIISGYA